ncbi:MAG: type II secretion system protein, partial [Saccharospirillaceae bacterium]|nr:type II secretion system GspH family protein [Pseudomonadales bacterium]NRB82060.1 type II secretion system protein [Saccharospirillaceae bacterium]
MSNSKGFSLIELIVVIAILGILMGAAAPSFISQMNKNKVNTVEKDLRLVIGRARLIALRNQFGFFGDEVDADGKSMSNAMVCFNASSGKLTLSLHEAANGGG